MNGFRIIAVRVLGRNFCLAPGNVECRGWVVSQLKGRRVVSGVGWEDLASDNYQLERFEVGRS